MKKTDTTTETKTRNITDAHGNQYTINSKTREIISRRDKHGFIYDSQGNRVGNVHGYTHLDGFFYD